MKLCMVEVIMLIILARLKLGISQGMAGIPLASHPRAIHGV